MLTLTPERLNKTVVPLSTTWLLSACMEAKGKQDLWSKQKPEVLTALRQQAVIQSAESSNRIEGVTIAPDRLRPVVLGKSKPRDRSEEELAGYRKAMDWIFSRTRNINITGEILLHLHKLAQGEHINDAGQWKVHDNEIIEILPNGSRTIRFKPTPAKLTPKMIEQLCINYASISNETRIPALLTIACFVFDFLCIHPFRDGNGRVSRLLTTALLQNHGFYVGRYVSIERLIEEEKSEYYRVLGACSSKWHEGKNEIFPWWNFFLGIIQRAYTEFGHKVESAQGRPAKTEMIQQIVLQQLEPFTLSDIAARVPAASSQLIKKVLAQLKKDKYIKLSGHGRGAKWEIVRHSRH